MSRAVRGKISARKDKAKACYEDGLKAVEDENWVKAASSLYMAHQYEPKNAEYKSLWEKNQHKSNQARAAQFISLAENAESFRNVREAMENYRKATECEPVEGLAYYRFGQLLKEYSGDPRSAVLQFRHAVMKEPKNVSYRAALAHLYMDQKMNKNAIREFQKVVELDPKNKEAKSALRKLRF
jgi:tetratricopeptide (TPR) repeat protein